MRDTTFELMRVWAALTGIVIALWYFGQIYFGTAPTETLPMLVAGIGGFELFLYGQDLWLKKRGRHG